jgi:hypothetical protein
MCPECGSTDFYVDGFVGYRQPYDAKAGEYSCSDMIWDDDYATGATCASCEKDVTDLFKRLDVLRFYAPEWRDR